MDHSTSLPPQLLKQFAQLADYLGRAQKVALEISRSNPADYNRFLVDLIPPDTIPDEDAWFWSKEWQAKEQEVNKNISQGRVEAFDAVEDLLADLNS